MSSLKKVSKNTLFYFISSAVQRGSSILLFPIFTAYLSSSDYGIYSVTGSIAEFIILLAGMELSRAMVRFLYDGDQLKRNLKALIGSIFILVLCVNVILATLLFFTGDFILGYFLNDIPFRPFMLYSIAAFPFIAVFNLYRTYLQATHQGDKYVVLDFLFFLCNIGLNLYLVIVMDMGVLGLIVSTLISSMVFSVYVFIKFFARHLSFDWAVLKPCLIYALPLIPFILLGKAQSVTDSLMLNAEKGVEITGIYHIAMMMVMLFSVLKESFTASFTPWFFENFKDAPRSAINKVVNVSFIGMGLFGLGISWFSYEVLILLSNNEDIIDAWKYTPILVNGVYISFLGQIFNLTTFQGKKYVAYLSISTFIGLITNFALCTLLIGTMGAYGAALASIASFAIMTIILFVICFQSNTFHFNYLYLLAILILILVLSTIPYLEMEISHLIALKIVLYTLLSGSFAIYVHKKYDVIQLVRERFKRQ